MLKLFARYASVGAVNTLIHWIIFAALYSQGFNQSMSNFAAFCCAGNDSNLLVVFYVQIMPDDFVMQLHRF